MNQTVDTTAVDVTHQAEERTTQVALTNSHIHEQSSQLIRSIAEAASNPKVDVVKMQALMAMRKEVMDEQRQIAFDAAFSSMQAELPEIDEQGKISIIKDGKQVGKSQPYAKYEDIQRVCRPILAKYGFGTRFEIDDQSEKDFLIVTCILSHHDGHRERAQKRLPKDHSGSKNIVQAEGSSVSYGKRYTYCAILDIATRGQDDDGRTAVAPAEKPRVTTEQAEHIIRALGGPGQKVGEFCTRYQIENIQRIRREDYDKALATAKRFAANGTAPENNTNLFGESNGQ